MINVGVVGLGSMGLTHINAYKRHSDVCVIAVAEHNSLRRTGQIRATGNIDGQAAGEFDLTSVRLYSEAIEMIHDPSVDVIDICVGTPHHGALLRSALRAGKHVIVEKPLARTAAEALELADLAEQTLDLIATCAMCMRFWPAWQWLKEAIDHLNYGRVRSATFRRLTSQPAGRFYLSGPASGGAVLDLHVHDTDFVQYCFGLPRAVTSVGYTGVTGELDHLVTHYHYDDIPIVTAEGGWTMSEGFGFRMQYTVNFELATAVFELGATSELTLHVPGSPAHRVHVPLGDGYTHEIAYFLNCVRLGERPTRVTLRDAALAIATVEAEVRSARSGRREWLTTERPQRPRPGQPNTV